MARQTSENSPRERLRPLDQEHYEVACSFEGFFDEGQFSRRYRKRYPGRNPARIRPARYSFNQGRIANSGAVAFLWWDGDESYVFVGFMGAPKSFRKNESGKGIGESVPAARPSVRNDITELHADISGARRIAHHLHTVFQPGAGGIFGIQPRSQSVEPAGMQPGSLEHVLFLTFTNSVNRVRDARDLWERAGQAWIDPDTRYLFDPAAVHRAGYETVRQALVDLKLARKSNVDSAAWYRIARTLHESWSGDPRKFLEACNYHAPTVLARLRGDQTPGGRRPAFPLLRGEKIAPLWVRLLRERAGVSFRGLHDVPVAVDIHVLRATFCSGAIKGKYSGQRQKLFDLVRKVWKEGTGGLRRPDGKELVPLDIDEALWTLGGKGCAQRGTGPLGPCPGDCPLAGSCVEGTLSLRASSCNVDTSGHHT